MSVEFLHLRILPAAMSIITSRMQIPSQENAGATPRIHAAGPALEKLQPIGLCTNWNLPQIQPVPVVDFPMIEGTVVPPLVDWDCAHMNHPHPQLLHLLDSVALTISLDLVHSMDLLASCLRSL